MKQSLDIKDLEAKALKNTKTIVYPEGNDPRILEAVRQLVDRQLIQAILISKAGDVENAASAANINLEGITVTALDNVDIRSSLRSTLEQVKPDFSPEQIEEALDDRLIFAALMTKSDLADCLVAGIEYTTKAVVRAALRFVGLKPEVNTASSFFIMALPHWAGPDGNRLAFADAGFNIAPDAQGLADIAISTADSTANILGWTPRVAFVSFSTKGSATDSSIERINQALSIVQNKRPDIAVDGELQVDAAIVPEVAARKISGSSAVAGRANVLIFPDLNAGNIAYKLVERLAEAHAYGPLMQGFAKPVSDLSRGSSVEDIIGVSVCVALM